jgi:hypothetical protein
MAKMKTKGAKESGAAQPGTQGSNAKPKANMGYSHAKVARKSMRSTNTTGKGAC